VYCSVSAQFDNLGDVVIRRAMMRWLETSGTVVHVCVKGMPPGYVHAIRGATSTREYGSHARWQLSLLMSSLRRPTALVLAPGAQSLVSSRHEWAHLVVNLLNTVLLTGGGHVVLKLGRSYWGASTPMVRMERYLLNRCTLHTVRDVQSAEVLRTPCRVEPDLGFVSDHRAPVQVRRRYLAVSLRDDRPIDDETLSQLAREAQRRSLALIFVTQVTRDDTRHVRWAARLGAEVCSWTDESYVEQVERVLEVYRASSLVVSNRLHALVLGMSCGATALPLVSHDDAKLLPTLRVVDPDLPAFHPGERLDEAADAASCRADAQATGTAMARARLEALGEQVRRHVRPRSTPRLAWATFGHHRGLR
jgi:hypothetical protein